MKTKITGTGNRIAIIFSSLLLLGALMFPIWKIDLSAPQYPEGLSLKIWANKLTGNIETVNGLNHYIGMKTLHAEEFVEFKVLPGILLFFSVFGIIVGFLNNRKILYIWMIMFLIFSAISMADFYYWEYNYGHNLDPTAPIQVPGMAYQPPLLGYKQMLNFGAFSIPDIGGWFFIGSGFFMFILTFFQWKKNKMSKLSSTLITAIFMLFTLNACSNEIKEINYGKDNCSFCKMTIIDKKFGVEIISQKGKTFLMDDLNCAQQFVKEGNIDINQIEDVYINNFNGTGQLINLKQSFLVKNPLLGSPMGGNMAAFSTKDDANKFIKSNGGETIASQNVILQK